MYNSIPFLGIQKLLFRLLENLLQLIRSGSTNGNFLLPLLQRLTVAQQLKFVLDGFERKWLFLSTQPEIHGTFLVAKWNSAGDRFSYH